MRIIPFILFSSIVLASCGTPPTAAVNPDPNHTHADFAVWIDGTKLDFNGEEFMSGSSDENDPDHTIHDPYLHLHDGNGHVIHRHKPGLTIGDFLSSLPRIRYSENVFSYTDCTECFPWEMRLFVNGVERPEGSSYVFTDLDHIIITSTEDPAELQKELAAVTDDACLYSKTCPERGESPTENCIADPTVPCVGQ